METKFGALTVSEVRQMMGRDIKQLMTGIDLFNHLEFGSSIRNNPNFYGLCTCLPMVEAVDKMTLNIERVVKEYLTYDPEIIPDPIDHCRWIVEKQEEIKDILRMGFDKHFMDEPFDYVVLSSTMNRFEFLFKHLVGVCSVHKFSEEVVRQRLYADQIRPDEEE